jgi:hypothetical protein
VLPGRYLTGTRGSGYPRKDRHAPRRLGISLIAPTGVAAVKQPHALLKVAVVVSSVLLAGGFVAYRAGAFRSLWGTSAQTEGVMPSSKRQRIFLPTDKSQPVPPSAEADLTIMGGSKSDRIEFLDLPGTMEPPAIIGSPESIAPLIVPSSPGKKGAQQAANSPPSKPAP